MIDKIKKISLFIVLFLIFILSSLFYKIPLKLLNIDYNILSYNIKMLLSIGSELILLLILFLIYKKDLINKFKEFKNNFNNYFDYGFKIWFLGLIGMIITNIILSLILPTKEATNEVLVQENITNAPLLSFISIAIIGPFIEEMIFRKSINDIFKNKILMVIISGLIFGLLHVVFSYKTYYDLLYFIPYSLLGSSFAYMLKEKNNIFLPITFHMLHNGILTLLSIIPVVLK